MPDRMVVISRVNVAIPSAVSVQQNPLLLVWPSHPGCRYIQSGYNQNLLYALAASRQKAVEYVCKHVYTVSGVAWLQQVHLSNLEDNGCCHICVIS